jgi:hypothetical protein
LGTKELTNFKDRKVETSVDALNVSTGKCGGRSKGAKFKSKGGDKWSYFHYVKKGQFKRDCQRVRGQ